MDAFTKGGNGFLATWAGAFSSFAFAYHEFVGVELNLKRTIRQSFSLRCGQAKCQPICGVAHMLTLLSTMPPVHPHPA